MAEYKPKNSPVKGGDEIKLNTGSNSNGAEGLAPTQIRKKRHSYFVPSRYMESAVAYGSQRQTNLKNIDTLNKEGTFSETKLSELNLNKFPTATASTPKPNTDIHHHSDPGFPEVSVIRSAFSGTTSVEPTKKRDRKGENRSVKIEWDLNDPMDKLIIETQHLLANYQAQRATHLLEEQEKCQKAILNNLMTENMVLSDKWATTARRVNERKQMVCECDHFEKLEHVSQLLTKFLDKANELKENVSQKDYNRLFYSGMNFSASNFEDDIAARLDRLNLSEISIDDDNWKAVDEAMNLLREISDPKEGSTLHDFISRVCINCKKAMNTVSRALSILLDAKAKRDRQFPSELNRALFDW